MIDMLHVENERIVNSQGETVRLRGVCIGGWMNMESFINGFPGSESGLRAVMAETLGSSRAKFFFERWLDLFITEEDIRFIRDCGANVVRLPFNYRHFERDARPFHYLEDGFERLSKVLAWCRQYGIWAILDLHAAPGWQNPDWHSDNPSQYSLFWQHPHFQDRFIALWQEIASRYVGEAVIAGYDLMNEPFVNVAIDQMDGKCRSDWSALNGLYRRVVNAVRAVDPDHIIFLEGDGFATRFSGLDAPFADNLVYSSHNYNRAGWGPGPYPGMHKEGYWDRDRLVQAFLDHEGTQFSHRHSAPLWVGEFGSVFNGPAGDRPDRLRGFDDQISIFEQFGVHWTSWTYKDIGVMGWACVDPQSEYLVRIKDILEAKLQLHSDAWMYWLPPSPAKDLLGGLAGLFRYALGSSELDIRGVQGRLAKLALGGYGSSLLQAAYADLFKGMTETQIDGILQSFALQNCRQNTELVGIVRVHLLGPAIPASSQLIVPDMAI